MNRLLFVPGYKHIDMVSNIILKPVHMRKALRISATRIRIYET